jgi:2-polyprenyl-6-methoxyphenol hydroxylase-like FAD-dependent oxidoreductase
MDRGTRIAVLGAGLAGLTAAGLLQRAGFSVDVYDQSPSFSRIGAGIILGANVSKVLRRLDLENAFAATGIRPDTFLSRAWDSGEQLYRLDFDAECDARFGGPFVNIHRADLHRGRWHPLGHARLYPWRGRAALRRAFCTARGVSGQPHQGETYCRLHQMVGAGPAYAGLLHDARP